MGTEQPLTYNPEAFVFLDRNGEPLRNMQGELIVIETRSEAERWPKPGEKVRPLRKLDREPHPRSRQPRSRAPARRGP